MSDSQKISYTELPSFFTFLLVSTTLGWYAFYFLYKETRKINFKLAGCSLAYPILAIGNANAALTVFYNVAYTNMEDPSDIFWVVYLWIGIYLIHLVYAYFYLLNLEKFKSSFDDNPKLTKFDIVLLIAFGVVFVSARQNGIVNANRNRAEHLIPR